jgi:hypothetical protein
MLWIKNINMHFYKIVNGNICSRSFGTTSGTATNATSGTRPLKDGMRQHQTWKQSQGPILIAIRSYAKSIHYWIKVNFCDFRNTLAVGIIRRQL